MTYSGIGNFSGGLIEGDVTESWWTDSGTLKRTFKGTRNEYSNSPRGRMHSYSSRPEEGTVTFYNDAGIASHAYSGYYRPT